jgi:cyanophycinase
MGKHEMNWRADEDRMSMLSKVLQDKPRLADWDFNGIAIQASATVAMVASGAARRFCHRNAGDALQSTALEQIDLRCSGGDGSEKIEVPIFWCLIPCFLTAVPAPGQTTVGPPKGAIIVQGGGDILPEIWERFVTLAGGPDANFVFIPTADEPIDPEQPAQDEFPTKKFKHVTVLHTRCRMEADSEAFVAPLRRANGVWFGGGRQWRLVDSYLNTRTQRELQAVLDRGGVIGGSSAGATILGSYLVRDAISGNEIMMAKGYEEGFGYLKNVAIDQHVDSRKREEDMTAVIMAYPVLLGIGLEEPAAIVVRGDEF